MKINKICLGCCVLLAVTLCACGKKDPELTRFKTDIENFCTNISTIDTAINNIDAGSDGAVNELLIHLDKLDEQFTNFAELDFPEQFDYLEPLADEAASYMDEAVNNYHTLYKNNTSYDENVAEYAKENYIRAYKRIQIIISFLHGEDPESTGLVVNETP